MWIVREIIQLFRWEEKRPCALKSNQTTRGFTETPFTRALTKFKRDEIIYQFDPFTRNRANSVTDCSNVCNSETCMAPRVQCKRKADPCKFCFRSQICPDACKLSLRLVLFLFSWELGGLIPPYPAGIEKQIRKLHQLYLNRRVCSKSSTSIIPYLRWLIDNQRRPLRWIFLYNYKIAAILEPSVWNALIY